MPRLHLGAWVDSGVDFLQRHLSWLFDAISALVTGLYDGIVAVLSAPAPLLFAGILAVAAWWLRGLLAGLLAFAGFALVDSVGLWDDAMATLSLVLVATLVTLVFAIPLGIWASRSDRVSAVLRPALDFMQTMPAMVYLIPGIIFFGVGVVPGIVATIIFSLPPGVRMTELGIRQVDEELVEAANAFGTTPRNTLVRVQLPLALPTIMAGVNQVIMLGLSMVVIAGMVGGGGLGGAVYRAIGSVDIGLGFEAGIAIVILAMYLDRMTGALGRQVSPLGRRALAKARSAATGAARVWNHRPQPALAVTGAVILALVAGGLNTFGGASAQGTGRPAPRTSARAAPCPSATSRGTRASPPPSCGRSSWSAAASRSTRSSWNWAPCSPDSRAAGSTSRPMPGCPSPRRSTGRSTGTSWTTSAPGTAPPRWS